jgi:hypothetical protein
MFHQGSHCVYSTLYWVSATTAINAAFKARPMMLGMGLLETAKTSSIDHNNPKS